MVITALIVAFAMAASFWAGTKYPERIAERQDAWIREGATTAEACDPTIDAWDLCPYKQIEARDKIAFWMLGFKRVRPLKGTPEPEITVSP